MSTRATYRFTGEYQPTVSVYIHHDGYPTGAACYLWAAYKSHRSDGGGSGGIGTHFVRANDRAEITDSHDIHGDTEYRYDVTTEKGEHHVTCRERVDWTTDSGDNWRVKWSGTLADYLNGHADFLTRDGFRPLRKVKVSAFGGPQWFNAELARGPGMAA